MVEENPVDSKGWEEILERELSADGSDLDAEVRLAQILLDNALVEGFGPTTDNVSIADGGQAIRGQQANIGQQVNIGDMEGNIGRTEDDFRGDKVAGDKVVGIQGTGNRIEGDKIEVGDISGSSGVSIGRGSDVPEEDLLDIDRDVDAFAALIASKNVTPLYPSASSATGAPEKPFSCAA